MTKISMDIKHMPASHGYSYILVLLCEVSNYMVALPLHSTRTPHILQVFQKGYVAYFGPPTHIVCDQDASFTSSLMHSLHRTVEYQSDICESHKSQIPVSRTWDKEFVKFVGKTFD